MSKTIRKITLVAVAVVAVVAGLASYVHVTELCLRHGQGLLSFIYPLAIDGMIVVSSLTMWQRRKTHKPVGWLPWACLVFGMVASLAANVAVAEPTLIGRIVSALPSLALAGAGELLMEQLRVTAKRTTTRRRTTTATRRKAPAKRTATKATAPAAVREVAA